LGGGWGKGCVACVWKGAGRGFEAGGFGGREGWRWFGREGGACLLGGAGEQVWGRASRAPAAFRSGRPGRPTSLPRPSQSPPRLAAPVAARAVGEHEAVARAVHGLEPKLLLLHLKGEHVFAVVVRVPARLPEVKVEHVGGHHLAAGWRSAAVGGGWRRAVRVGGGWRRAAVGWRAGKVGLLRGPLWRAATLRAEQKRASPKSKKRAPARARPPHLLVLVLPVLFPYHRDQRVVHARARGLEEGAAGGEGVEEEELVLHAQVAVVALLGLLHACLGWFWGGRGGGGLRPGLVGLLLGLLLAFWLFWGGEGLSVGGGALAGPGGPPLHAWLSFGGRGGASPHKGRPPSKGACPSPPGKGRP
jgi:hypothetical protein